MKPHYKLFSIKAIVLGFSALLMLASCGSYEYAGYDNDGIYSSGPEREVYAANNYEESYEDALYYEKLFAKKSEQFANIGEEGIIFTDIEAYSSGSYEPQQIQDDLDYSIGRAPWGADPDAVSINIHQNPFYGPYYTGFYSPFWDPYYGYRYSLPYFYGYGYPYHYGYAYNSWGIGFGWNSWRYGYNNYYPGYQPYYGGYTGWYYYDYDPRDVAYLSSRRGSYDNYSESRINDYTQSTNLRDYRSQNVRAVRSNYDERTYKTRTSRVRNVSPVRRNNSYSRGRSSDNVRAVRRSQPRSSANTGRVRSVRRAPSYDYNQAVRSSSSSRSESSSTARRSSRGRGN